MSIDAFPPSMTTTTDDDTLDALAGLSTSANTMPYFTGVDTAALTVLTPFMRTLLDDPDLATAQTTLGITGGGGGAPTDAVYIVGSANATLTQERVLTTTPTIAWDLVTAGQAKANVPDASLTEAKLNISDVTTQNVSVSAHGLTPKLSGVATEYLSGTGLWTVPPAGTTYTDEQAQDAVGAMLVDTATIDLTYGDGGPTLQADVKDLSITEAKLTFVDVTTQNASTSTHGLLHKLSGVATEYLSGTGTWTVPPAGTTYTDEQAQDAIGAMLLDTATIDLVYVDATPSLSASVIDASITEAKLGLSDVTTKDATTSAHGLLRKLSGTATQYLDGSGAWTTPAGGTNYWSRGGTSTPSYLTGMLAWWRLEEASGNRVDSIGGLALVPQGTPASLTNAAGKPGQALAMDSTLGAYLSLADNATMSVGVSTAFTIACWVYIAAAPGSNQWGFVGKGNVSSTQNTCEYHWWMAASTFRFIVGNGSSRVDRAYPGVTVTAGQWYFLVGWWDAGTLSLQINNSTVDSSAWAAGSYDSTLPFEVGRQLGYHAASSYLNGRVDNIMFWRRTLTTQERTDLYNGGAGVDYSAAVLPYVTPLATTDRLVLAAATTTQERLEVDGAVKLGTTTGTTDGIVRWTGTDMEARKGGAWVSMTAGAGGQPLDATLTALAGLATAADRLPYFTGVDTAALATFTAAGRTLAGAADAAAQRGALALGTMAQQDASAVAITGGTASFNGAAAALELAATTPAIGLLGRVTYGTSKWNLYCDGTASNFLDGAMQLGGPGPSTFSGKLVVRYPKGGLHGLLLQPTDTDTGTAAVMFQAVGGVTVGSITTTGAATAYNTTSDSRLKHAVTPLTGALDVVRALKPIAHLWRSDDSRGYGFAANEVQQVLPDAGVVTGEADAVDEEGRIQPQMIDYSKLVPWLTAALQETLAQVQALTARVVALEGAMP